ncbi:MAG: hypothetical protein C0469_00155 [Cyanobacteria bacterium DS2.3.42]|nr:hypothetical protein [Cyanobacteria bacterium DS2.3.42]
MGPKKQEKNEVSNNDNNVTPTAAFGLSLLKKEVAAQPGKNVLLSPLSVSVALGMAANGARDTTLSGNNAALSIDTDQGTNNKGYAALLEKLKRDDIGVTLYVANAIFARLGVGFNAEFVEANNEFFNAKVDELDFDDPATLDAINSFVSEATNKKIDKILEDPIAADTVMFLVNCVYFKGEWTTKFDKRNSTAMPFAGAGDIPLMYRRDKMIHGKDGAFNTYQFVSLPFGQSGAVRMLVFLPAQGKTVDDVLSVLDETALIRHASDTYKSEGEVWLPRIEINYENSLNDSLRAMGIEKTLGDADFSGIIPPSASLYTSDVKHKTVFKVDEEGAEGAAATPVGFTLQCASIPFKMKVDRPFVTFVVDSSTNAVLFAGVITDPTK